MLRHLLKLLTFLSFASNAQVNLVRNPGFEEYSQCPNHFGQLNYANYWSAIDSLSTSQCVPTYCNTCATAIVTSVPSNGMFYQQPHSGEGLAEFLAFFDDSLEVFSRSYVQGRLAESLINGQSYCVSFYVNLCEMSHFAIDRIGAYLDDGSIDTTDSCFYPQIQYLPQVQNPLGIIDDIANWVKIEGSFIANGTESFISIGNFYDLANTNVALVPPNNWNAGIIDHAAWYLIDDVSVIRSDLPAFAGNDTVVSLIDSLFLGRGSVIGLDCKWYENGVLIDSGSGIWVHPVLDTNYYVVAQALCGLVTYDTVRVIVVGDNATTVKRDYMCLKLSPNPAAAHVTITASTRMEAIDICDVLGRVLRHEVHNSKEVFLDLDWLEQGIYLVAVYDINGNKQIEKIIKQ